MLCLVSYLAGHVTLQNRNAIVVLCPVILCGGSGTRLWPLSRTKYPKQFMDMGGYTLFGNTLDRAMHVPGSISPVVCCNEEHRFYVAAAFQERGNRGRILLEPEGRNTAPAIALVALAALEEGDDPFLLVLPSDHILTPEETFVRVVEDACACAMDGALVTFGVTPAGPETGFGYICQGNACAGGKGYAVVRFVEKPDFAQAEAMLAEGGGVFVEQWHVSVPCFSLLEGTCTICPGYYDSLP